MTLERQLAATLHGAFDDARPSADLPARIVERTRTDLVGRARGRSAFRLATLGGTLAAAALVAGTLLTSAGKPAATPSGSVEPLPLAHHDRGDISFDYPAAWSYYDDPAQTTGVILWWNRESGHPIGCPVEGVKGYVDLAGPQLLAAAPSDAACGGTSLLTPGAIFVSVRKMQVDAATPLIDPAGSSPLPSGESYVSVGGVPATYASSLPAPGLQALDWTVDVPGQPLFRIAIHAEMRDPAVSELRARVESLVASIVFDSPAAVLDPSAGPAVAAAWLRASRTSEPGLACFAGSPGTTNAATVSSIFAGPAPATPRPVSCRWTVRPAPIGLWKVTLDVSWTAAADRLAGTYEVVVWLNPDGTANLVQPPASLPVLPVNVPSGQ